MNKKAKKLKDILETIKMLSSEEKRLKEELIAEGFTSEYFSDGTKLVKGADTVTTSLTSEVVDIFTKEELKEVATVSYTKAKKVKSEKELAGYITTSPKKGSFSLKEQTKAEKTERNLI